MPKRISDGSIQRQRSAEITEEMRRLRQMVGDLRGEIALMKERADLQENFMGNHAKDLIDQAAELVTLKGEVAVIKTKVETPKP